MKNSRVVFVPVFIACVILGFWVGTNLRHSHTIATASPGNSISSGPSLQPANDQRNILIVATDNLDQTHPSLASIWLLTYFPNNPSITLQPIYPELQDGKIVVDEMLSKTFQIITTNSQPRLSGAFINALTKKEIWWSGYFIIDRQTFAFLSDSAQMVSTSLDHNGNRDNQESSARWFDVSSQFQQEKSTLQSICDQLAQQDFFPVWNSIQDALPQLFSTTLDTETVRNELSAILNDVSPAFCVLPLNVLAPLQSEQ